VIVQGLDVGSIGTETVFSDNEVEMGVVLTQLDQEAFGGIASQSFWLPSLFTIVRA